MVVVVVCGAQIFSAAILLSRLNGDLAAARHKNTHQHGQTDARVRLCIPNTLPLTLTNDRARVHACGYKIRCQRACVHLGVIADPDQSPGETSFVQAGQRDSHGTAGHTSTIGGAQHGRDFGGSAETTSSVARIRVSRRQEVPGHAPDATPRAAGGQVVATRPPPVTECPVFCRIDAQAAAAGEQCDASVRSARRPLHRHQHNHGREVSPPYPRKLAEVGRAAAD